MPVFQRRRRRMIPHLILDDQSVATVDRATFRLNPATKHPLNPVLTPGRPEDWDSLQVSWPGTVLYDATAGLYRCWYSGMDAVQSNRPDRYWNPGYAESPDGVHWSKPALMQVEQDGRPTNRLKQPPGAFLLSSV